MESVTGQENGNTMNRKGERRTDRMHGRCPVCENLPRGPLCRAHRRELAKTLHGLRLGLVELKWVERREVRYSTGTGGGAHPAFAPAAIDISAADLYNQVEDTLQDVAGDIGLWAGKAPALIARLQASMGRLADAPNSGRDFKQLTNAYRRVRLRITPPEERIIHGHCLNPECGAQLAGLPDDTMVTCQECGSTWAVAEVRRARRERMTGQYITGKPKLAAQWISQETGIEIKRGDVSNWRSRGLLHPVETDVSGVWQWAKPELLACAEHMRLAT